MYKPTILSRAHHTQQTASELIELGADVATAGFKARNKIEGVLRDGNLSNMRHDFWAGVNTPSTTSNHKTLQVAPAKQSIEKIRSIIFSVHSAKNHLRDIVAAPKLADTAKRNDQNFCIDHWLDRRNRYCDDAALEAGVDLTSLAGKLASIVRSKDPAEQRLVEHLFAQDYINALAASPAQRAVVIDVATIFAIGKAQEAFGFAANWSDHTRESLLDGALKLVFPVTPGLGDADQSTIYKVADNLANGSSRSLRHFERTYHGRPAKRGANGKWPGSIVDLHDAVINAPDLDKFDKQRTITSSLHEQGTEQLSDQIDNILQQIGAWSARFQRVHQLREECVARLQSKNGINIGSFRGVTQFRAFAGGLSQPAFLLAIAVDCLRFAQLLQANGPHQQRMLASLDPFCRIVPPPAGGVSIHNFVTSFGGKLTLDWNAGKRITGSLGYLSGLASKKENEKYEADHHTDDDKLAAFFLSTVTLYRTWFDWLPHEYDALSYRDHHWQGLYTNYGLIGHLFR